MADSQEVPTWPEYVGEFITIDESHHASIGEIGAKCYFARTVLNGHEAYVAVPYSDEITTSELDAFLPLIVADALKDFQTPK